jgi:hypothetical protein
LYESVKLWKVSRISTFARRPDGSELAQKKRRQNPALQQRCRIRNVNTAKEAPDSLSSLAKEPQFAGRRNPG